jgi:hypothetical protein
MSLSWKQKLHMVEGSVLVQDVGAISFRNHHCNVCLTVDVGRSKTKRRDMAVVRGCWVTIGLHKEFTRFEDDVVQTEHWKIVKHRQFILNFLTFAIQPILTICYLNHYIFYS